MSAQFIGIDPAYGDDRATYCAAHRLPYGWDAKEHAFVWYRRVPS